MNNQQTVLTALGCAGSLATMLAVSSPAIASPTSLNSAATLSEEALAHMASYTVPGLAQNESNPITDALSCSCTRCMLGGQRPIL